MGDFLDDVTAAAAPRAVHPKGWEPGYETSGTIATGTAVFPDSTDPDSLAIIAGFGLDPEEWAIVGNVNCRRWQTYDERWLRYYKCDLQRRAPLEDRADIEAMCKRIAARKITPPKRPDTGWASFAALSDWQLGKGEGGGTPATIDFLKERLALLDDMWKADKPSTIFLGNEGDLSEGVAGHYASQAFTVDLDQRQQDRAARRMLMEFVETAARRAPRVILSGVACNHGENRNGAGKAQTRPSDNRSLTYVENVQESCAQNPGLSHVEFQYAPDTILVTDIAGIPTVHTHGHIFDRGGGAPMTKCQSWWGGQIVGLRPAAAALVMVTAHRHHAQVSEENGRTIFMAPACDGGSQWFTDATGKSSPRGLLTFKIGTAIGDPLQGERCWDDLRIL